MCFQYVLGMVVCIYFYQFVVWCVVQYVFVGLFQIVVVYVCGVFVVYWIEVFEVVVVDVIDVVDEVCEMFVEWIVLCQVGYYVYVGKVLVVDSELGDIVFGQMQFQWYVFEMVILCQLFFECFDVVVVEWYYGVDLCQYCFYVWYLFGYYFKLECWDVVCQQDVVMVVDQVMCWGNGLWFDVVGF